MIDIEFETFKMELEERWINYQMSPIIRTTDEYLMHKNVVKYDKMIRVLKKFKIFCFGCTLPLMQYNNYRIAGIPGELCSICYLLKKIELTFDNKFYGRNYGDSDTANV